MMTTVVVLGLVALALRLLYLGRGYLAWVLPGALALAWWGSRTSWEGPAGTVAVVLAIAAVVTGVPAVRRVLLARVVMGLLRPPPAEDERH